MGEGEEGGLSGRGRVGWVGWGLLKLARGDFFAAVWEANLTLRLSLVGDSLICALLPCTKSEKV